MAEIKVKAKEIKSTKTTPKSKSIKQNTKVKVYQAEYESQSQKQNNKVKVQSGIQKSKSKAEYQSQVKSRIPKSS